MYLNMHSVNEKEDGKWISHLNKQAMTYFGNLFFNKN